MRRLPATFRIGGFDFQILGRGGDIALFQKTKPQIKSSRFFEIVIIQRQQDHVGPRGNLIPAGEHLPRSEDWGTYGWSYSSQEDARRKFDQLVAGVEEQVA
jgi:hypothetical protein